MAKQTIEEYIPSFEGTSLKHRLLRLGAEQASVDKVVETQIYFVKNIYCFTESGFSGFYEFLLERMLDKVFEGRPSKEEILSKYAETIQAFEKYRSLPDIKLDPPDSDLVAAIYLALRNKAISPVNATVGIREDPQDSGEHGSSHISRYSATLRCWFE